MQPDSLVPSPSEKTESPVIVHALHRLLEIVAFQVVTELAREGSNDEKMLPRQEYPSIDIE